MHVELQAAVTEDAESIAALRNAISDDLTFKHGRGPWTAHCTTAGVLSDLREAKLVVAVHRGEVIASFKLSAKKPLALGPGVFPKIARPFYLTALVVAPDLQRQGIGRTCLDHAAALARREKAGAIFLDTFDHPTAGAGPFFSKYGYKEIGRATYRGAAVVCFQIPLGKSTPFARKQSEKS